LTSHPIRRVIILGATGSIGSTALRSMEALRDSFEIVAISAHTHIDSLKTISQSWNVRKICITQVPISKSQIEDQFPNAELYLGSQGLLDMIRDTQADVVLNGIVGSAGLLPTIASLESGKDVALANKESIVMAGDFLFETAARNHVSIFPVDSEHSAIYHLLASYGGDAVSGLILTASGGPFRDLPYSQFSSITIGMATAHPTWKMGPKISVDSATLANKGLEVIEASYLFGFKTDAIEIVIHPQSIIHSMIRMANGAVYAQMSPPDMALPIMSALAGAHIPLSSIVVPLDFTHLNLTFSKPDFQRFPLLKHAVDCANIGGAYPIAFNGANETAVQAFLDGRISFTDIHRVVENTLESDWSDTCHSVAEIMMSDERSKNQASQFVAGVSR